MQEHPTKPPPLPVAGPIMIHEDDRYRRILGLHLSEADVSPNVELIKRHKKVLARLLVDTAGGILSPYPIWDAVQRVSSDDPELSSWT
jgi:hypothetical protein